MLGLAHPTRRFADQCFCIQSSLFQKSLSPEFVADNVEVPTPVAVSKYLVPSMKLITCESILPNSAPRMMSTLSPNFRSSGK